MNAAPRDAPATDGGSIPRRALGSTGEHVSMVGMGGYHLGLPREDRAATELVHAAIDHGITFMDNCWDYHDGRSEERMGRALAGGYREKVFLMTKIDGRTRDAATRQIEDSLRRLKTDRIDLIQLHEVIRFEDPDRAFSDGGAIGALVAARDAGKLRFIGFTGHKDPAIHLRMLEVADEHGFRFDTLQMPLNVLDAHFRSFEKNVLPVAQKKNIGVLGMKPIAAGKALQAGAVTAPECLRYAMSLAVSVVITGIDSMTVLEQAVATARGFVPYTPAETAALLARTAPLARGGRLEEFKTTTQHDGTAKHPAWLG